MTISKIQVMFEKGGGDYASTVALQWLEYLWSHENMFETEVVRANEC